jgi:hypothetical protein
MSNTMLGGSNKLTGAFRFDHEQFPFALRRHIPFHCVGTELIVLRRKRTTTSTRAIS